MPAAFFQHIYFKKRRLVRAAQQIYHTIAITASQSLFSGKQKILPIALFWAFMQGFEAQNLVDYPILQKGRPSAIIRVQKE